MARLMDSGTHPDENGLRCPGGDVHTDLSCRDLGLDTKTWIEEDLVDYVCPSLFSPRLPGVPKTADFAPLVRDKEKRELADLLLFQATVLPDKAVEFELCVLPQVANAVQNQRLGCPNRKFAQHRLAPSTRLRRSYGRHRRT